MNKVTLLRLLNLTVLSGYSPTSLLSTTSNSWELGVSSAASKSRLGLLAKSTTLEGVCDPGPDLRRRERRRIEPVNGMRMILVCVECHSSSGDPDNLQLVVGIRLQELGCIKSL